jgi:outer membrane protein
MQTSLFTRSTLVAACVVALSALPLLAKETKPMESKSAAAPKVALVDVRRIIAQDPEGLKNGSDEWRELFGKLQDTLKPAQREIAELEERYKKKASELESLQKSGISSKEALRKKYEEELAPLEFQLQNQAQQYQRFSYDELGKAQQIIGPKIEKVINSIRTAQGWDMIINREAVISFNPRYDITQEVLELLNKQYAMEKAKKAEAKKS